MADKPIPNPIDVYVGQRVRTRRKFMGLSQSFLATELDLTFQQVQKYERGTNRISASMLHGIANALKVPIKYFFEGYTDGELDAFNESESEVNIHTFLASAEGIGLAKAFPLVKSAKHRRKILDLVKAMAEEQE